MQKYVLYFKEIDKQHLAYVGGKGANLGEMTKAGFPVPQGFCVTTEAYRTFIDTSTQMSEFYDLLDRINADELEPICILGQRIREHLKSLSLPEEVRSSILEAWNITGQAQAYAVRSSATAEDLPTASFAGQQDTYLNVLGPEQLLQAVQDCWASLFADRAISYRAKNGFGHRLVFLSVVVQQMVFPEVAGIMFTADPITGHRKTISIDASFGLGEALVSGIVTADLYQVRSGKIIKKQISKKKIAIYSVPEGGTFTQDIPLEKQEIQALEDHNIIKLAELGQRIEVHYGSEQDIEWGLADGEIFILQSRPITSLHPAPKVSDDKLHVYVSFSYIQVMTDAMKPLAISLLSYLPNFIKKDPASSGPGFLLAAGGRAFADVTGPLLLKPSRNMLLKVFKGMDELMASAMSEVIQREEFRNQSFPKKEVFRVVRKIAPIVIPILIKVRSSLLVGDPSKARIHVASIMKKIVKEHEKNIMDTSGADRLRVIHQSMETMFPNVLAKIVAYPITGILASGSLAKKLSKKVGDKQGAYLLSQLNKSLPGNVTGELGLELGDLTDIARKYPEVIDYLGRATIESFYEDLLRVSGGFEFKRQLEIFLDKYGMRCSGEIDITKPRWNEDPTQLVPSILSNIRTTTFGEHREKFKRGEIEADQAAKEILSQFSYFEKRSISRLIKLYRNLMGTRENHKFIVIMLLDIYKRAILEEGRLLVQKGILRGEQDVYYFTMEELISLVENRFSGGAQEIVEEREKQHVLDQKLTPPRVMTSEGEIITGKLRDVQAPAGALIGTPVSAGIVEGIARVVLRLEDAKINPGEILIAPYTDPGWTPLFISIKGLITEVGGTMTHGSVVAREYGIPAVVGIDKATEIIKDGSLIRINGTEGFVQILSEPSDSFNNN
ncbi:phosphoenolpyruvate synthase [Desulfosporosinus fructosivorans]|uniref:Phosphoenolpyruvate synthase n=1 Tax=Desulfosporosinus fructosivorans TaxID=2018669 RepID=A0A4Z0R923_9FIRM|nr:phosphoenolpyruvate synthase [Desulfosporosinus fructosivorans]TGE38769.1 phosphoenolpyruvate synthase [Desulfosporosinus fructosivorans]